jgi:hypothetical protein
MRNGGDPGMGRGGMQAGMSGGQGMKGGGLGGGRGMGGGRSSGGKSGPPSIKNMQEIQIKIKKLQLATHEENL